MASPGLFNPIDKNNIVLPRNYLMKPYSRKASAVQARMAVAEANSFSVRTAFRNFIRELNPEEWEKIKHFLRTGRGGKSLGKETLKKFARIGFKYAEKRSQARGIKYATRFSKAEEREIKVQVNDFAGMLFPGENKRRKEQLVLEIYKRMQPIRRAQVMERIRMGDLKTAFNAGRMYLDALDPEMNERADKRRREKAPKIRTEGYHDGRIILSSEWHRERGYDFTTPMHEAVHHKFGPGEYPAYLVDLYYNLKKGHSTAATLKRSVHYIPEAKAAFETASALYRNGMKNGWKSSDRELRTIVIKSSIAGMLAGAVKK